MSQHQQYSDEEILDMIRRCNEEFDSCSQRNFESMEDTCSVTLVQNRFGMWSDAKKEAGVPVRSGRPETYSDEEILEMLRRCEEEHDICSPRVFNSMEDTCSASLVMQRFGKWTDAKKEAGIETESKRLGRERKYSDEQILSHIRECARRNDGKCTVELLQGEEDLVAPSVAVARFGSWINAKKEAGVDPDARTTNARPREYTDEDYLEMLRECEEKHGEVTQSTFNEDPDFPSAGAVRKRFGKWSAAKEEAGIETDSSTYSGDELLEMLRECKRRYGSVTASRFASDDDFCSPETLQRRFGSWSDAKEEAGVE